MARFGRHAAGALLRPSPGLPGVISPASHPPPPIHSPSPSGPTTRRISTRKWRSRRPPAEADFVDCPARGGTTRASIKRALNELPFQIDDPRFLPDIALGPIVGLRIQPLWCGR